MADDILRWVRSSIHSHLFTVFRTFGRSFVCFFMDPSAIPANIYFGWGGWGWVGVKDRFGIVHGFLRKLWSIFRVLADISDYFQKNSFLIGFIFWNLQGFLRISPHFFFFSPFFFFFKPFAIILPTFKESVSEILHMLGAPNSELVLGGVSWLFLVSF